LIHWLANYPMNCRSTYPHWPLQKQMPQLEQLHELGWQPLEHRLEPVLGWHEPGPDQPVAAQPARGPLLASEMHPNQEYSIQRWTRRQARLSPAGSRAPLLLQPGQRHEPVPLVLRLAIGLEIEREIGPSERQLAPAGEPWRH
jgi:hypothetical protein